VVSEKSDNDGLYLSPVNEKQVSVIEKVNNAKNRSSRSKKKGNPHLNSPQQAIKINNYSDEKMKNTQSVIEYLKEKPKVADEIHIFTDYNITQFKEYDTSNHNVSEQGQIIFKNDVQNYWNTLTTQYKNGNQHLFLINTIRNMHALLYRFSSPTTMQLYVANSVGLESFKELLTIFEKYYKVLLHPQSGIPALANDVTTYFNSFNKNEKHTNNTHTNNTNVTVSNEVDSYQENPVTTLIELSPKLDTAIEECRSFYDKQSQLYEADKERYSSWYPELSALWQLVYHDLYNIKESLSFPLTLTKQSNDLKYATTVHLYSEDELVTFIQSETEKYKCFFEGNTASLSVSHSFPNANSNLTTRTSFDESRAEMYSKNSAPTPKLFQPYKRLAKPHIEITPQQSKAPTLSSQRDSD